MIGTGNHYVKRSKPGPERCTCSQPFVEWKKVDLVEIKSRMAVPLIREIRGEGRSTRIEL
jgi:hypothetical protein